ncbi:MAG: hypothetical protein ACYC6D_01980 [Melioribacteraceae bacterium]
MKENNEKRKLKLENTIATINISEKNKTQTIKQPVTFSISKMTPIIVFN